MATLCLYAPVDSECVDVNYCYVSSPIGRLLLAGHDRLLGYVGLPDGKARISPQQDWRQVEDGFPAVTQQLKEYFSGQREMFSVALLPAGTDFQISVWSALREIPYGQIRTYAQIAEMIGRPRAVRAVGAANGANPLPILVPCHRVIGANGSLTGFAGGLAAKSYLLGLESAK